MIRRTPVAIGILGTLCPTCADARTSGIVGVTQRGRFGKASLVDGNGDPVADAIVVSDSGYSYLAPEPTLPMLECTAVATCLALRIRLR